MAAVEHQKAQRPSFVRMASGHRAPNYSLADPEMAEAVEALRARLTSSPEESIKFLKKVGILNRSGKLSKNFGG